MKRLGMILLVAAGFTTVLVACDGQAIAGFSGLVLDNGPKFGQPEIGSSRDNDNRCRLEGRLQSGAAHPLASGKAKAEKRDDRVRLGVDLEDVDGSFIGTLATVTVDGVDIGTLEIVCINPLGGCTLGDFDLNLDTRDGDTVLDVIGTQNCGDLSVEVVVTDMNGDVIVSGTMTKK